MEGLGKLERQVLEWLKGIPHLPVVVRKWIADNVWWIAVVALILTAIGVLVTFAGLMTNLSLVSGPFVKYYNSPAVVTWLIIQAIVTLVFAILDCILLGMAITPLKEKQKKGWVLLFAVWLLGILSVVVNAVLTLNILGFITTIIFGALWLAVVGYFLFEIHGQFAHVERSRGVKAKKVA